MGLVATASMRRSKAAFEACGSNLSLQEGTLTKD